MLGKPSQQLLCSLLYSLTCVAGTAFSIPPQQAEAGAVFWKASQWVSWKPKLHVFMRSPQELRNQNHFQFIWSKSKLGGTLNSNSQFRKKRFLQEVLEKSPYQPSLLQQGRGKDSCLFVKRWNFRLCQYYITAATTFVSLMPMLIRHSNTSGCWGKTDIVPESWQVAVIIHLQQAGRDLIWISKSLLWHAIVL